MRTNKQILMMMAAVVIAATAIFAGCKKDETKVKVTGVSVCPTAVMLYVDGKETLTADVTPSNANDLSVAWTSDKTNVATVNADGIVTAHATGEATITCTTKDGGHKATTTVIVNPARNDNDYATLVPSFYFGNLTMGEETVGTNSLITVKYHTVDSVVFSIDEKFDIPSINLTNIPMQVSCTTKVTKEGNEYKAVGETKATFMNFPLPVEIKATFDDAGKIDMDIYVSGIPIPNMGNIVVNFKGLGQKMIEPCFLPD